MDRERLPAVSRVRRLYPRVSGILGGLLRRQALCPEGGLLGDRVRFDPPELSELVSSQVPVRLREVSLRPTRPRLIQPAARSARGWFAGDSAPTHDGRRRLDGVDDALVTRAPA